MSEGWAAEASSHMADGNMESADLDGDSDAGGGYDQADDFGDDGGHDDQDAGFGGPADQGGTPEYGFCVKAEQSLNQHARDSELRLQGMWACMFASDKGLGSNPSHKSSRQQNRHGCSALQMLGVTNLTHSAPGPCMGQAGRWTSPSLFCLLDPCATVAACWPADAYGTPLQGTTLRWAGWVMYTVSLCKEAAQLLPRLLRHAPPPECMTCGR